MAGTERVQFDQLCAQNLATLWRQNAWMHLIDGHQHFKVRPECVQGFVHEKLGEACEHFVSLIRLPPCLPTSLATLKLGRVISFPPCCAADMSNRLGKLSRDHLDGKSLVLYFEGKQARDSELMRSLQQCYKHFGCEDGLGHFEIIYITSATTQEAFASSFRYMPWLTLPFTHALRREQLRNLWEVNENEDTVVLLHMDGSTITRDGKHHMKVRTLPARRCSSGYPCARDDSRLFAATVSMEMSECHRRQEMGQRVLQDANEACGEGVSRCDMHSIISMPRSLLFALVSPASAKWREAARPSS